jgi:ribosomal-protein-alanine N-acetyltransferase
MTLRIRPVTADDVRVFAAWRYDPPYDVYNQTDPIDQAVAYFIRPDVQCHVLVEDGHVAGFCTFGHDARVPGGAYPDGAIDIGLGVAPHLTGRGRGREFVDAVIRHARSAFPGYGLRVTIAEHNRRAFKVWSGAGFTQVERFETEREILGGRGFVVLVDSGVVGGTGS